MEKSLRKPKNKGSIANLSLIKAKKVKNLALDKFSNACSLFGSICKH
jgi:hypothetical protein